MLENYGMLLTISESRAFIGMVDSDASFVAQLTKLQLSLLIYVRSLLPGDPDAGDVAQQANAKIWEKKSDFVPGTNFRAWAFAIARFEVLNHRKKQARDARLRFSDELESIIADDDALPAGSLLSMQDSLRHCLMKMRDKDRQLLMHRYASSGTLLEFADQSGRSSGGLKVTLHRLRNALSECINRHRGLNEGTT